MTASVLLTQLFVIKGLALTVLAPDPLLPRLEVWLPAKGHRGRRSVMNLVVGFLLPSSMPRLNYGLLALAWHNPAMAVVGLWGRGSTS